MTAELHIREKPAIMRRTWLVSVSLLTVAFFVAAGLSWQRSGDHLAAPVSPDGWSISFRPPRRVGVREFGRTPLGSAFRFQMWPRGGAQAVLTVMRLEGEPVSDPLAACERVLRAYFRTQAPVSGLARFTNLDTKLGPFEAVEICDPVLGVTVRAATTGDREAYAVSLGIEGPIPDKKTYHVFDEACRSIEYGGR